MRGYEMLNMITIRYQRWMPHDMVGRGIDTVDRWIDRHIDLSNLCLSTKLLLFLSLKLFLKRVLSHECV